MNAGSTRRALAVVALVAAFGACSSGDDDADKEDVVDDAVDGDGPDSVVPGSAELEEALLTLDDLPDGLIDLGLHYSGVEICGMRTEMPDALDDDQFPSGATAFAVDEPIVPDVLEKIVAVPAGAGAEVFERVRWLLDTNCNGGGEVDGLAFVSATDLAVPTLGDESVAKRSRSRSWTAARPSTSTSSTPAPTTPSS